MHTIILTVSQATLDNFKRILEQDMPGVTITNPLLLLERALSNDTGDDQLENYAHYVAADPDLVFGG